MLKKIRAIYTENRFFEMVEDDEKSSLKDDEVMGEMSLLTLIFIAVASVFGLMVLSKLLFLQN
jgi:hypothetical protein